MTREYEAIVYAALHEEELPEDIVGDFDREIAWVEDKYDSGDLNPPTPRHDDPPEKWRIVAAKLFRSGQFDESFGTQDGFREHLIRNTETGDLGAPEVRKVRTVEAEGGDAS